MLLYIFRHGEAKSPETRRGQPKEERHLTPDGKLWVGRVISTATRELGFKPEVILSSPLARAKETAEIARQALGGKVKVGIEDCLEGDRQVPEVYRTLRTWKAAGSVALVSHLPLIDHLIADLLGGDSNVGLYSGAIACIRCKPSPGHGKGT